MFRAQQQFTRIHNQMKWTKRMKGKKNVFLAERFCDLVWVLILDLFFFFQVHWSIES